MGTADRRKRRFGTTRQLPSGRWQARYTGPDLRRYKGPRTWADEDGAIAWLKDEDRLIELDMWRPPEQRDQVSRGKATTVSDYVTRWNKQRDVKESTRAQYESYARTHLDGTDLADRPIGTVTIADIRGWWADVRATSSGKTDGATRNARVYSWLRSVFESAVDDGFADRNPCRIKGAGQTRRQRAIVVPSAAEVDALADAMPERLALLVTLASWCAMRRGELLGLRRRDIAKDASVVHVRRGVTFVKGQPVITTTKSGRERSVAVPPHIRPAVLAHLRTHVTPGAASLLFPSVVEGHEGDTLDEWTLRYHWDQARKVLDRNDLRLHDLRHAGSVWAATAGATLPELQRRLGHSTSAAAIRYQHAAEGSDARIAVAMSKLVGGHGD